MKLGISIEIYRMDEVEEKVRAAAESGFKYCQMFLREVEATEATASKVAEVCRKFGLKIGPVGAYANPLRPDESPMGTDMKKVKEIICLLPILGSSEIAIWSGSYSQNLLEYSEGNYGTGALKELASVTDEILGLMESINGKLIFEPYYTHVLHDEDSIVSFINLVQSDRVKVVMDPPNFISPEDYERRDEKMVHLIDSLHKYIGAAHFKDFRLAPDGSWDYPGPGGGEMNYPLFFRAMAKYEYDSWGIIEHVKPQEYASAETFIESQVKKSDLDLQWF